MELEELQYKSQSNMPMKKKQEVAYNHMKNGKSVFVTGPGGTGKTAIIKHFVKMYKNIINIGVTSTTGTSAILFGGVTLHSFTGIGLGTESVDKIVKKILNKHHLRKRWNELQVLVVDEISMMSPDLFDKLENIAREVRFDNRPFGGIQLVLSGDFCQLPCVDSEKFCYEAEKWEMCVQETVYLDEIIRQKENKFQTCLNNIRLGHITSDVINTLESRIGKNLTNESGIKPTKLYPLNCDVDRINEFELDNLGREGAEFYEYEMDITIHGSNKNKQFLEDKYRRYCTAPVTLQLCIGAQVMLLWNLDQNCKLVNGSRGVVIGFIDDNPVVRFLNGEERIIEAKTWDVKELDECILSATQIPLKLAYALSIHKSQGCSLDYAEIDLSEIFEYGQAYVALSRVKSLEGLSIISFDPRLIVAHPHAVDYYEKIDSR